MEQPTIDAAIAAWREAEAEASAFDSAVFDPVQLEWRRRCEAVPHYTTTRSYHSNGCELQRLSTESSGSVAMARRILADPPKSDPEFVECLRELTDADDRRIAEQQRLKEELNVDELKAQCIALWDAAGEALRAVESYPVRTLAELIRKVEMIEETGGEHATDALLADLRRIAGEGGQ